MININVTTAQTQAVEEALRKLAARLEEKTSSLYVGVPKGKGTYEESGLTLATVAAINEFGSSDGHIPPRPFLHPAIANNAEKFKRVAERRLPEVLMDKISLSQVLDQLGTLGVSLVQKQITNTYTPPNAPYTIAKKGSSHPLIDTGRLKQSIEYVILDEPPEEGLS